MRFYSSFLQLVFVFLFNHHFEFIDLFNWKNAKCVVANKMSGNHCQVVLKRAALCTW